MNVTVLPWLGVMALLLLGSAFFSGSEAALFYLTHRDRRVMASGNRAQRLAVRLLADSDRLLMAVLFCNLVINVAFFVLASSLSLRLEREAQHAAAGIAALGSLLAIILFGEVIPKSLAVLQPRLIATALAIPLGMVVRLVDPLMPALRLVNLLSLRLLWPGFRPEPYLAIDDLQRAVRLSTTDESLREQEQKVLENIVSLSQLRADELMRPRRYFRLFRPPLSLADLRGHVPPTGFILLAESDSDEVGAAIPIARLGELGTTHLERFAEEVRYVPWCAPASSALELLERDPSRVVCVINELGETIGILTFDDVLDTVFSEGASRSARLLKQQPIREVRPGVWHVVGMTTVRRLTRYLNVAAPPTKAITVAGVVQELLERLPQPGDRCSWGPLDFQVLEAQERGSLLVQVTRRTDEEERDS